MRQAKTRNEEGGVQEDQRAAALCCTVQSLALEHLDMLIGGEVLAIRQPDYFDRTACAVIADRLLRHELRGSYENGPHIGRIGMAYFEATTDDAKRRYYQRADATIAELRRACRPYANPIDLVRLDLDGIWPAGIQREQIESHRMFVGLIRILEAGSELRPHQDVLEWDAPAACADATELKAQFSVNVYIDPGEGGELELWDCALTQQEYAACRIPLAVALDRAKLPPPAIRIRPRIGELIMFDTTKIHCVRSVRSGMRITASCFIGVRGRSVPLSVWS